MGEALVAQYGVCCLLPFFCTIFPLREKPLEAVSRVDIGHMLGPESHVSIASLVRLLLAMTMEIWDTDFGPFRPIFAVFAILGQVGNTISPWGKNVAINE